MISAMMQRPTDRRVELKAVGKTRAGGVIAVESLDLVVKTGELVALLGPRGCGKTTVLRIIAGLDAVTGGKVMFDGLDVTDLPPARRDVAFAFQCPALYPHLTVAQNIAFPLRAQRIPRNAIERRVEEVIDRLELEPIRRRRPRQLSEADRQRVSLARAMVRDAKVILLDEPLAAVCPEQRERSRRRLRTMHNELRATTLLATDDPAEAAALGDRVVTMEAGKVVPADAAPPVIAAGINAANR